MYQPTVKFRDIKADLLNTAQQKTGTTRAQNSDSESDDEFESASDSESVSASTAPRPSRHGGETDDPQPILPKTLMNLSSPQLLDLLSDTPCTSSATQHASPTPEHDSSSPDDDVFEDF